MHPVFSLVRQRTSLALFLLVLFSAVLSGFSAPSALAQSRAWGDNTFGQLGSGSVAANSNVPVAVSNLTTLAAVSAGADHSLALTPGGSVYSWGHNDTGQLGNGTGDDGTTAFDSNVPVQVSGVGGSGTLSGIMAISGGFGFGLALKSDGTVYSWGYNGDGELGNNDGSFTDSNTPVQVVDVSGTGALSGISTVAAGYSNCVALKADGTLYTWGFNGDGELGDNDGTFTSSGIPVQVINADSSPFTVNVGGTTTPAVAAGNGHVVVLRSDGTVWAWGYNFDGELGDNGDSGANSIVPIQVHGVGNSGFLTGVVAIAANGTHTLALKSDGTVYAWGTNGNGELGNNNYGVNSAVPVQVHGVGNSGFLSGITGISAGGTHSLAITANGILYAWGGDAFGQLGNGAGGDGSTNNDSPFPTAGPTRIVTISAGGQHSLALTNAAPVTGADSYSTAQYSPLTVNTPGVLANDTDAEGDALTAVLVAGPTHGSLTLNSDGSFLYTPTGSYFGSDSFTYKATDAYGGGNTATVSLTVNAVTATHFVVTAPATATAGSAFNYTVTAEDGSGNVATAYAGTVHFTSSDGAVVLPANSTLTNGVGTFSATLKTAGSQTITATDTVTSSITGTSNTITVAHAAATHFTVTAPATATAGSAISVIVTALDAFGNTDTGYAGTVHFTSSDGQAVLPANITLTSGVGTFSATLKTAGSQTVTATDTVTSSITGTSGTISVSAAAATHFTVTAPATATAGSAISVIVTALDAFGNTDTGYAGTVHFTSSDGQAVLPANATLTNGTGTFSATLKTAGSQTVTATDTVTAGITGTSNTIIVTHAAATHYAVSAPSNATAGSAISVTVTALDAYGNTDTGYTGTAHFTSTDPQAILPADSTLTNGTGTFSATLKTAGTQTITATDTVTSSITGTSNTIAVSAASVTHFTVSVPATAAAGSAISVTVTALDAFGNTDTGYAGTVHFTSSDGQAVLPANATLTNGIGTFSATLKTAGSQTVTATDTVTSSITGTSNAVTVSGLAADHFVVSAPSPVTSYITNTLTVTAEDQFGNVDAGYSGTVHFTSSDPAAVLPADGTLTNGSGSFNFALKTAGAQTITATDTVTTSITGTANITVDPGPATRFTISAPATATAGSAFNYTVTARDLFGNVVPSYSGTVHFTSTDGAATLPADSTLTNGVGTFSATLETSGTQTVTATDTLTSSITGTSNTIAVSAATATHFTVTAPATATAGSAISVTVMALDQFDNVATGYSGTVHFTSSDGQAVLPANATLTSGAGTFSATLKTAGSQTITATDTVTAGITGTSNTITVTHAAATHYAVSAPTNATAGSAFNYTVTALDAFGNTDTGYAGTVHFTSSDGQAVLPADITLTSGVGTFSATLKTAGSQTVTATDTVTASITGTSNNITVDHAAATNFIVSAPASATAGSAFNYTVTALDAYGNTDTGYTGTVHFTSTDGAATLPADATLTNGVGTFSATLETSGSQTITATDTVTPSITGTSGSIVVGAAAATHFTVTAPANATAGSAFSVTVTALDQFDNVATGYSGTVHFTSTDGQAVLPADATLASGAGTFSATLKTAGSQTITATDTVTSSITGTSNTITVTNAAATHFTVAAPATATAGTPVSVTVTALDAFGNTDTGYAGTVHFTSSDGQAVLPADGTLTNGTGTFSATLKTAGTQTITATDTVTSSITGTSNAVTVSAATAATAAFVQQPTTTVVGAAVTPAPSVLVTDTYGNPVPGVSVTVSLNTGTGTLAGTTPQTTDATGTATFPDLSLSRPGQKVLGAAADPGVTAVSSAFTVTANDALTAQGVNVSAVKRVSFTAPVASLIDTNAASPASDFTATIDWGDGATSAGTVGGSAGSFTVTGTHSYQTEGAYSVKTTVTDVQTGGPTAQATSTATVKDVTAPTTTAALSPASPNGGNGYYTVPITVTLTATDPDNTSAQITTFYKIDGGAQQTYTQPFTVSGDASHTVTFFSKDPSGNTETAKSVAFKIDAVPPVTTASTQTTASGVQVTLSAADDLSGVASTVYSVDGGAQQTYTGPFVLAGSSAHTFVFGSVDKAGNAETLRTLPVGAGVLHTFPSGLQLFSVPKDFSGIPLGTALSQINPRLAVWVPAALQYVMSPTAPADALRPGQGYWARFGQATSLYDLGTPTPTAPPFSISLKKGWNMIGDPFPGSVSLGSVQVVGDSNTYTGLKAANQAGLVGVTLYSYPAGSGQYQTEGANGSLEPYVGYWIYAFRDCALQVPAP